MLNITQTVAQISDDDTWAVAVLSKAMPSKAPDINYYLQDMASTVEEDVVYTEGDLIVDFESWLEDHPED